MKKKMCPRCARLFEETETHCPRCKVELIDVPEAPVEELSEEELKKKRRSDWMWIILGVPALILLIYAIGYVVSGKLF